MKALGVTITDKLLNMLRVPGIDILYSIESTLSFVEALKPLIGYGDIEVEPKEDKGDVDVKAVVDGKTIAFQVKLLHPFKSKVAQEIMKASREFTNRYLSSYGKFLKVIFIPQQGLRFTPKIIEYRKVDANVNVSYASLLYPTDLLTQWVYPRIVSRIKRCYQQLKAVDADYRVAVIDIRREPVNEFIIWSETQSWLMSEGARYPRLSGVIFMRYDTMTKRDRVGTWLIPAINPHAENPLDLEMLLKNIVLPIPSFGTRYLLILQTHIHIPKPGCINIIRLEPGFKLMYRDVYFGTII